MKLIKWPRDLFVEIEFENKKTGKRFSTKSTPEHPFFVYGKGWVQAEMLQIGDSCRTASDKAMVLQELEVVPGEVKVYNFQVREAHTYFVGETDDESVLVHNECASCGDANCTSWHMIDRGGGVLIVAGGVSELLVGGTLIGASGITATPTAGGSLLLAGGGLAVGAHGVDNIQAGARQAWTGRRVYTVTSNTVANITGSRVIGEGVDIVAGIAGPAAAASALVKKIGPKLVQELTESAAGGVTKHVVGSESNPQIREIADLVIDWLGKDYLVKTNKVGDKVFISKKGDKMFRTDLYGNRDTPHIHFQEFINGKWVDVFPNLPHKIPVNP